jgi:hypothetical protein
MNEICYCRIEVKYMKQGGPVRNKDGDNVIVNFFRESQARVSE